MYLAFDDHESVNKQFDHFDMMEKVKGIHPTYLTLDTSWSLLNNEVDTIQN